MSKLTSQEKYLIVQRYLTENVSFRDLEKELGVDSSSIRYWVKLSEYHGSEAFDFPYTNYSAAFKLKVIQRIEEEEYSIREASAMFHIPDFSMVRRWRKKWLEGGKQALESARKGPTQMTSHKKKEDSMDSYEALKKENERFRMENEYLKKVRDLSSKKESISKEEQAQVIDELRFHFPVKQLTEIADIPRSTYYHWKEKQLEPKTDRPLKELITSIFKEHKGRYGYRRIENELRNLGHEVNHKKVYRLMKELGLQSTVKMKKYRSYKGKVGQTAPNILNRNFKADQPNQKWVTDITEFKLFGEKLYLSPVLDLFNGEIITYTIGSRPTYSLVNNMLDQAFERLHPSDELVMHSDQGWHYQMAPYRKKLKDHQVTQSMSRKGNCHDNAVMENFFGIMKSEFLYLREFESVAHFKQELEEYIHYYNHKRIKSKLRISPISYRARFQELA
ncbi:IS150-type transposase orfAB [Halobacillus halophilus DSM 2266]|uniref:IS150-type transposase orfAB n=1 Tax=Halobacillus halophilus (strain ATCC 35676 / DSM 2266 / JCM 20832 / KCTC 3685 / LMG 17431 / NBRC 102448 / NCIMB 2269) TaxID=866895 RepID=I0JLN8_HALH3|nr:IS150-type transposase orfAB [Halobacillus halophilus DSM 2266]